MRKSNYGIIETIQNVIFLILSKLLVKKSRLIRFPIVIRGKKYIDFGEKITTGRNCRLEVNGEHNSKLLIFGKNVNIGDNVRISCAKGITIGNNVLIGSRVLIIDNSHGCYSSENQSSPNIPPNDRQLKCARIEIGDNVWIGEGAVIQQGVSIGNGCIIAANSVVTESVPNDCIMGGVPARVIKFWNAECNEWVYLKEGKKDENNSN